MAVLRCAQGHFYDGEKFPECPHCKNPPPKRRGLGEAMTEYRPSSGSSAPAGGKAVIPLGPARGADEKTVGIYKATLGRDPVVGWLVCVKGKEAGRDYRLHAGRNFIGRALSMDVCLADDESVSREDHCSLVFEPNQGVFLLARGRGDGVMVEGERLAESRILEGDETIEIGGSAFVFVPFCRKGRLW